MEKNTAEKLVDTREATMWKSHVNATIRHVRSHFGSRRLKVRPTWPANNERSGGSHALMRPRRRRIDCEDHKTEFIYIAFLLPCVSHCVGRARRSGGPVRRSTASSDCAGSGCATNP